MKNPFVFISYNVDTTLEFVKKLSVELENIGIKHWYASRDMQPTRNHADVVPRVIGECSAVLVLLNRSANDSAYVKREFQYAVDHKKMILIAKLEDFEETGCFEFIRTDVQFLSLVGLNDTISIQRICCTMNSLMITNDETSEADDDWVFDTNRSNNTLDFFSYGKERERIQKQREFVCDFAKSTYRQVIENMNAPSVLDLGCNTGEQFMMYIEDESDFSLYAGVDKEKAAIEYASKLFGSEKCFFLKLDFESEEFDRVLSEFEKEHGLDGFDIITISMVILHCKNPRKVLDTVYNHLADGGRIIVLDIDDGFNLAYPDSNGYFQRAVNICEYSNFSGYRKSGREIYSYLSEIGIDNVRLCKTGISTVGMNRKQRGDFFDIYFWFVLDDLIMMNEKHPESSIVKSDLDWLTKVYDEMKLQFKRRDFFFTLGFVLFVAGEE